MKILTRIVMYLPYVEDFLTNNAIKEIGKLINKK